MDPRAAVAARLRSLFEMQSRTLADYRRLVDAQTRSLTGNDPDRFEAQLEAERDLLDSIVALRRASDALEGAYREAWPAGDPDTEAARGLAAGRAAALNALAGGRRAAVAQRLADIEARLRDLRRSPALGSGRGEDSAGLVDIRG